VLAASEETMLREIAEQGLKQCINLADIAVAPAEVIPNQSPAAKADTAATAATPWMEQLGEVGLGEVPQPELGLTELGLTEVEVIEEPELIELAQANPRTAEPGRPSHLAPGCQTQPRGNRRALQGAVAGGYRLSPLRCRVKPGLSPPRRSGGAWCGRRVPAQGLLALERKPERGRPLQQLLR
jgi:hypothetical protein